VGEIHISVVVGCAYRFVPGSKVPAPGSAVVKSVTGGAGSFRVGPFDGILPAKKAPELVGRKYIESLTA